MVDLRELLFGSKPNELCFVSIEFQPVGRYPLINFFDTHCQTWQPSWTRVWLVVEMTMGVVGIRVYIETMFVCDHGYVGRIQKKGIVPSMLP